MNRSLVLVDDSGLLSREQREIASRMERIAEETIQEILQDYKLSDPRSIVPTNYREIC